MESGLNVEQESAVQAVICSNSCGILRTTLPLDDSGVGGVLFTVGHFVLSP